MFIRFRSDSFISFSGSTISESSYLGLAQMDCVRGVLHDMAFMTILVCCKSINAQRIDIDRSRLSRYDLFGDQLTYSRGLLDTVTRKSGNINPVLYLGHATKDWIVIRSDFIISPPAGLLVESRFSQPWEALQP